MSELANQSSNEEESKKEPASEKTSATQVDAAKAVLRKGWRTYRDNWQPLTLFSFLFVFVTALISGLVFGIGVISSGDFGTDFSTDDIDFTLNFVLAIIGATILLFLIQTFVYAALIGETFKLVRKKVEQVNLSSLWQSGADNFMRVLLVTITVALATMFGFILLVIPAIIVLFRYSLGTFVTVDRGTNVGDSLRRSRELMKKSWGVLFLIWLAISVIYIILSLLPFISLIATIVLLPYSIAALCHFYESLDKKKRRKAT